jgi:hypothetical protein
MFFIYFGMVVVLIFYRRLILTYLLAVHVKIRLKIFLFVNNFCAEWRAEDVWKLKIPEFLEEDDFSRIFRTSTSVAFRQQYR